MVKVNDQVIFFVFTNLSELAKATANNNLQSLIASSAAEMPKENDTDKPNLDKKESRDDGDTLFTVKQFADYFQVSQNSARDWIKKGLIPIIKINKRIRIRKSEILNLERRRNMPR